jgi:hypothetical protein
MPEDRFDANEVGICIVIALGLAGASLGIIYRLMS